MDAVCSRPDSLRDESPRLVAEGQAPEGTLYGPLAVGAMTPGQASSPNWPPSTWRRSTSPPGRAATACRSGVCLGGRVRL